MVTPYCFMRKLNLINKFLLSTHPHVLQMSIVALHCIYGVNGDILHQHGSKDVITGLIVSIHYLFLLYRSVIFQVSSLSPLYSGPISQVISQFILFQTVFFPLLCTYWHLIDLFSSSKHGFIIINLPLLLIPLYTENLKQP